MSDRYQTDGPGPAADELPAASVGEAIAAPEVIRVEALLFVAERPLSRTEIGRICDLGADAVDAALGDLEVALRDRGIRLVTLGDQVQLVTAPEAGTLIGRFIGADGGRLTPAGLETLAIVAYRQPVTRGVIERIRGVDSDYVIRSLLGRRLIAEQGRADTTGRPIDRKSTRLNSSHT